MRSLALVSFALLVMTGAALAADAAPSAMPGLIEMAAGGIATMVVAVIAFAARKLFGITMDAGHRATLHSAVRTGAALALSVGADWIAKGRSPDQARILAEAQAVGYVRQAAGDALAHFDMSSNDTMLRAMLQAATAQLVPPQIPTTAVGN